MEKKTATLHAVNVRTLAETYYEGGDLFSDLKAIDRMQEGLKGHLLIETNYPPEYRSEVPVRYECPVSGVSLLVQGRIDGLMLRDNQCTVEEIKTTRMNPSLISDTDYPVHWAQAEIYAFIMAEKEALNQVTVRLLYVNLNGDRAAFTRTYAREKLNHLFYEYASVYASRLRDQDEWKTNAYPHMAEFPFPFTEYRAGQREMALHAYTAIKNRKKLLVEAPTGIGKTAAALFPALRSLGEGKAETIFYLTARTTGRKTAEDTLKRMREGGLCVRSVTIGAKKKVCPMPDGKCDPASCPYSSGYFDRQKHAVQESWRIQALDLEEIRRLSEKYMLCPFELSLALAETADVVIADYNYVFDPVVRLRRFFDRRGKYILLIDEAHNLVPRAREMYSAQIGEKELTALRREVGRETGRKSGLYKSLTALIQALPKIEENEIRTEIDADFIKKVKDFWESAKEDLSEPFRFHSELAKLFFDCASFLRTSEDFSSETHRVLITPEGKHSRVKLWCFYPTEKLKKIMKRMSGCILFSATLAPIRHYAGLIGLDTDSGDGLLSLPSPFPKENLFSARILIPTRYKLRDESAMRVAKAIYTLASSRAGNYLACFPSHAYMNMVYGIFASHYPDVRVLLQSRDMNEAERAEYLKQFEDTQNQRSMVAFIALGGVFSEGVDLPGERLIGAAIVGVGLPQLCFERNCLAELYDELGENGYNTAYAYPGIGKCLQAAGRVIRTENDVGAVLFIDDRYQFPEYRRLLSAAYQPALVGENVLEGALKAFWKSTLPNS